MHHEKRGWPNWVSEERMTLVSWKVAMLPTSTRNGIGVAYGHKTIKQNRLECQNSWLNLYHFTLIISVHHRKRCRVQKWPDSHHKYHFSAPRSLVGHLSHSSTWPIEHSTNRNIDYTYKRPSTGTNETVSKSRDSRIWSRSLMAHGKYAKSLQTLCKMVELL